MYVHLVFLKQPVYQQLTPGCQIAKQLSGPNPLSLSNKKNSRSRKMEFHFRNNHKIVVKPTMHQEQDSAISKALLEKFLKLVIINIDFESGKLLHFSQT